MQLTRTRTSPRTVRAPLPAALQGETPPGQVNRSAAVLVAANLTAAAWLQPALTALSCGQVIHLAYQLVQPTQQAGGVPYRRRASRSRSRSMALVSAPERAGRRVRCVVDLFSAATRRGSGCPPAGPVAAPGGGRIHRPPPGFRRASATGFASALKLARCRATSLRRPATESRVADVSPDRSSAWRAMVRPQWPGRRCRPTVASCSWNAGEFCQQDAAGR